MKRIICILLIMIALVALAGCKNNETDKPVPSGCDIEDSCSDERGENWKVSDLFNDDVVVYTMDEILAEFDKTAIIFYSFEDCPWCYDALPVLLDVIKDEDIKVYYVAATREERADGNPSYDKSMEFFREEVGEKMHIPFCAFLKDGVIVGSHTGTVEGHNAKETPINKEQKEELYKIYQDLYNLIK